MPEKKKPLPTIFREKHRNYLLDIYQPGRMSSGSQSASGCLQTMLFAPDGAEYHILARYREQSIGSGRYIKRGPAGRVDGLETLEATGALVGFLEAELSKREQERKAAERSAQVARLRPVQCVCGQALSYDPQEKVFVAADGGTQTACQQCQRTLVLALMIRDYETAISHMRDRLQVVRELQRHEPGPR